MIRLLRIQLNIVDSPCLVTRILKLSVTLESILMRFSGKPFLRSPISVQHSSLTEFLRVVQQLTLELWQHLFRAVTGLLHELISTKYYPLGLFSNNTFIIPSEIRMIYYKKQTSLKRVYGRVLKINTN